MDTTILVFLGIAVAIVVLAIILPRLFRKSVELDRRHEDLNRDHRDATDHATWIGIHKSGDGDGSSH